MLGFARRLVIFGVVFGFIVLMRILRNALQDLVFRGLTISVALVLAMGTALYPIMEGWSVLDSLYFCVITLTTVGFGDFTPETTAGKMFTILYVCMGLGFIMAFVTTLVQPSRIWAQVEDDGSASDRLDADQGGVPEAQ